MTPFSRIKIDSTEGGFTIIETLIAITLLVLALGGPMTLASKSLLSSQFSKDQITAYYLAQEAVEMVRYARDTNILEGDSWLSGGISACLNQNCRIDVPLGTVAACAGSGCPVLRKSSSTGLYGYTGSYTPTIFTRTIRMTEVVANREVRLTVTLAWQTGALPRTLVVEERLLNWR